MIGRILQYILSWLLCRFSYYGKLHFINLDVLKKHQGAALVVSNHSFVIDLYIPIVLNILLKRKVYVLAAAYPMPSRFKRFLAKKMGIIFVTKALSQNELSGIAEALEVEASERNIEEASRFYRSLAEKYNPAARRRIKKILTEGGLLFSFGQFHQPFFPMERAGAGLGKMIAEYSDVPIYPFSIVDVSDPPVEIRTRNDRTDLKRIDLLTDKNRKTFQGSVDITVYDPVILVKNHEQDSQKIIDEVMMIIASHLPEYLRGYYHGKVLKEENKYLRSYGD